MNSILDLKQNLADIVKEKDAAIIKGGEMANNKTTQMGDLEAQQKIIDDLAIREALLKQDLERMENEGKPAPKAAASAPKSEFKNVAEYLNAVKSASLSGAYADKRLTFANSATGMNEGTDAEGGYLVPPEYADGVIDLVKTESVLYPKARKVTINSPRLIETYIDETSRVDPSTGSRHGGILAYWKAEAAQYSAVKAALGQRTTNAHKLTAYCPVTEELLQDAPALESLLDTLVAKEFAFKLDDAIINGTGDTYTQPAGILASSACVTIAKESGQAAATINFLNVLKMYNALIGQCRKNAEWYINQDAEMNLVQLLQPVGKLLSNGASKVEDVSGEWGAPVYTLPGMYGNEKGMLFGKPVTPIEQCSAVGTKGDIILMDASQYLIVERTGVTRQMSMHVRFDYDESVFKYSLRVGGRPDWGSAITPYKGSTSRSPYVALATRA